LGRSARSPFGKIPKRKISFGSSTARALKRIDFIVMSWWEENVCCFSILFF
jgi:hypothetical protein